MTPITGPRLEPPGRRNRPDTRSNNVGDQGYQRLLCRYNRDEMEQRLSQLPPCFLALLSLRVMFLAIHTWVKDTFGEPGRNSNKLIR